SLKKQLSSGYGGSRASINAEATSSGPTSR
ncbi:unnamed protein product, partial [marine sediment metagenome]